MNPSFETTILRRAIVFLLRISRNQLITPKPEVNNAEINMLCCSYTRFGRSADRIRHGDTYSDIAFIEHAEISRCSNFGINRQFRFGL